MQVAEQFVEQPIQDAAELAPPRRAPNSVTSAWSPAAVPGDVGLRVVVRDHSLTPSHFEALAARRLLKMSNATASSRTKPLMNGLDLAAQTEQRHAVVQHTHDQSADDRTDHPCRCRR